MVKKGRALHDHVAAGILESAAVAFAERGEAVPMAEIARAAGVGRATLYRYFPTRHALLQGLAEAGVEELRERIADAELDTTPVQEGIARLTRGVVAAGSKYAVLAQAGKKHVEDAAEFDRRINQPVRDLLRRGIDDGSLRDDLPADVLFAMYTGLLEKALQLVIREQFGVERASASAVSVFLDGAGSHRQ
ncbi:helix-turn-helix domain-containing protein [Actinopolymorpha sp. B17G11]|uniref:TetR/AcrR family transcriptional regulator n=1 Tax=unclassified Actinopolymorpha TaxID=2627063 RepID=UPI0032D95763